MEYHHDPSAKSYGEEAASALGVRPERVFKTLVVALDGDTRRLGVAILPVSAQLDLKKIAGALGAKKACLAPPPVAERATGYVVGGISPLGQKKRLPAVLDASADGHEAILVSAGKRGLQIELAPCDLARTVSAIHDTITR
jgi:Cys-tRNA(Pro)/Cys-tRNA(Cys) deacylase